MAEKITQIRDDILMALLPLVPIEGWVWTAVERATQGAKYDAAIAKAVFPEGMVDVLSHFSYWMDREMLKVWPLNLKNRTRDKISQAIMARIHSIVKHREAEKRAIAFWARPTRKFTGAKILWRTADIIWTTIGDTATDYNYYTKRALLSGVIASTTLCGLTDTSTGLSTTQAFLDRRIENVMHLSGAIGKLKSFKKA